MAGKLLLTLKEARSFEGELTILLVEEPDSEGNVTFSLFCEKKPPLNPEDGLLIVGVHSGVFGDDFGLKEITKSIGWQQDIPPVAVKEILDILERQVFPAVPEAASGLDGSSYELLIEHGFNKVQFAWWGEPQGLWKALGELSKGHTERMVALPAGDSSPHGQELRNAVIP